MSLIIIIWGLYKIGIALFDYKGPQRGIYTAEIIEFQKQTSYYDVYKIKINKQYFLLYIKNNNQSNINTNTKSALSINIKNSNKNINITKVNNTKLKLGSIIQFNGEFDEPSNSRNEGGFNYKLYLKTKKISGIFKTSSVKTIGKKDGLNVKFRKLINNIRKNIKENYENNLSNENSALLLALTIGDKTNLEKDAIDEFRNASLSHIIAISGAHFSYIILMITFINKILKRKRLGQSILILIILFFMNLTGNTTSVIRAGIMAIMSIISSMIYRKNDFLTTFSLSLLVQIFYNPYVIFDIGLILSYFGTYGIVYFYKIVNSKVKLKFISVTISANLFIFPIILYNFNTFSASFIISNFFASILLGPIIILGIISNIFKFRIIFILLNLLLTIFRKIVKICSKLPLSKIYVSKPSLISIILYYLILIILQKWYEKKNFTNQKEVKNERKSNNQRKKY